MVIYTEEKDLHWYPLLDKGLEVALLAHADPGSTHGELVGLSRAFELAKKFDALPISHILSYELMMDYPEQFTSLMNTAGSNHTWLTSTLCIYAGDERITISDNASKKDRHFFGAFGYLEESSGRMTNLVLPKNDSNYYDLLRLYDNYPLLPSKQYHAIEDLLWKAETTLESLGFNTSISPRLPKKYSWKFKTRQQEDIPPFLYVDVPAEQRNKLHIVSHPYYTLNKQGSKVSVEVEWNNTRELPRDQLYFKEKYYQMNNSSLLPTFLQDDFKDTQTSFYNPTLGFFGPAESYWSIGRDNNKKKVPTYNHWTIATRGEAVIIQRPSPKPTTSFK